MNNKKLKHIKVYDKLYGMIQDGTYPVGSQLPSETVLSAQMGVSRMTLRKALTLLQDDGLAKNVQGVGHFICNPDEHRANKISASKDISNPVHSFCTQQVICEKFEFRIEPPTKAISDSLNQYTPAVIIADRWYKSYNSYIAYSLSIIPIDRISEAKIDLNQPQLLLDYLENICYNRDMNCNRVFSHSSAGNFTAKDYVLSDKDSFLLIQENIKDSDNRIIVSSKHFIPIDKFRIETNT